MYNFNYYRHYSAIGRDETPEPAVRKYFSGGIYSQLNFKTGRAWPVAFRLSYETLPG